MTWDSSSLGFRVVGRDRVDFTRNGVQLPNNTSGNDAGQYSVPLAIKGVSTHVHIKATVNGWAAGNQDAAWNLQYKLGSGGFATLDRVYRQNNSFTQQSLGATLEGWVDYPPDPTQTLDFRLTGDIAGGGFNVAIGGTNFTATFFR